MNETDFIKSLKKDLLFIHKSLPKINENDLELLLSMAIRRTEAYLKDCKITKKPKSTLEKEMIENRVYPEDYLLRAKYILKRLRFHYPNYKKTIDYFKLTKKLRFMGIPPFEFYDLRRDMSFYSIAFKMELKEFYSIFKEYYLNRLSLSQYAEKYYGDKSNKGKKRAENLNNRFCAALAKALELKDITDKQSKIYNDKFELYRLMKETEGYNSSNQEKTEP